MGETTMILSLPHVDAPQWNKDLMQRFQAALESNPAADLMSMFSDLYRRQHHYAQGRQKSWATQINLRAFDTLCYELGRDPEINLLSAIPKDYNRRITMATGPKAVKSTEEMASEKPEPDFRTRLDVAETATVVLPLSEQASVLLAQFPGGRNLNDNSHDAEQSLIASLKQLLWNSQKLWQLISRGMVVKCNDEIVAKVIFGNNNYTEYTSMEFLEKRMPDIPVPRPHGLIAFGPFRVIFMSYIPGVTLTQKWRSLSHNEKLSIPNGFLPMHSNSFLIAYSIFTIPREIGRNLGISGFTSNKMEDLAVIDILYRILEYVTIEHVCRASKYKISIQLRGRNIFIVQPIFKALTFFWI